MNEIIDGMIVAMNKLEARHERTSFNLEKDGKRYWIDIAIFEEKKEDE